MRLGSSRRFLAHPAASLALVATAALTVTQAATAAVVGTAVDVGPEQHPAEGVVTLRVYLVSDNGLDAILAISNNEEVSPLLFETDGAELRQNCAMITAACACDVASVFDLGGDSWVNLGTDVCEEDCDTVLPCDCPGCCIAGNAFGPPCVIGYFDQDPGTPVRPDENGRILIAQFSLPAGTCFSYIGTVDYVPGAADGFVSQPFQVEHCVCLGDLDVSGSVDFNDLLALLAAWGPYEPCAPHSPPDLDKDCAVGFDDLLILLSRWGPCE